MATKPASFGASVAAARSRVATISFGSSTHRRAAFAPTPRPSWRRRALEIDFSDPSVLLGVGAPVALRRELAEGVVFMVSRDKLDEERVEALRELNRETFEATGEYLSKDELTKLRTPRWTDRREYKDDD